MTTEPNALIHESSPYLLQHARNPVKWNAWNPETLQKALSENKLMIISVGYSACHWCHVMEHESFEDPTVAGIMNEHFVSVKVDREERPDVDQVYMHAAYLTTGRGGWPLNVITLPDGTPVYGGTYFPRSNWIRVLEYFSALFRNDPKKMHEQARRMLEGIQTMDTSPFMENNSPIDWESTLNNGLQGLLKSIDWQNGGKGQAPKFMMPDIWDFLLTWNRKIGDEKSLSAALITLDKMALGGLYDHLAGGFARYSTDELWKVPHFEKMLYDNAQLISLYAIAYSSTKNEFYKRITEQTIRFCQDNWLAKSGGYYSAYDADSDGEEGKFYTWTKDEIQICLGDDAELFDSVFTISGPGNWEHGLNVLHRVWDDKSAAEHAGMSINDFNSWLDGCRTKLLIYRQKRNKPLLDNKQLCSWNALMISGLCDAYSYFTIPDYLQNAIDGASFIEEKLILNGKLHRNHCQGKASIPGFLDDHALLVEAYLQLYSSTFNSLWIQKAVSLTEEILANFSDENGLFFYYTSSDEEKLISRPIELSDNVISSSNSIMAHNLWRLGWVMDRPGWRERAKKMCCTMSDEIQNNLAFYSNWAKLAVLISNETIQVAITGKDAISWLNQISKHYFPGVLFVGSQEEVAETISLLRGKQNAENITTAFICRDQTCGLPILSPSILLTELHNIFHQSSSE